MTRKLGGNGRRGWAILASLSLAAALASGGTTVVGCGSNSGSSSGSSSGGQDSGPGDSSPKTDSGPDSSPADTGVVDTGVPDNHVEPQLASPTFTPPGPAALLMGSTVTINPPANLPTGGQLYWLATGAIPSPTTGNLYIGPIQVNTAETIIAIAHDPANNLSDSPPASAVYTITQPEAGSLGNVGFMPGSITEPNDFLVQLSGSAGATICYTLDGTTPTCNAGACTGASKTYSAGTSVSVDGTQTQAGSPPTGKLTITALQCEAGDTNGPSLAQDYQLIVSDPTMVLGGKNVPVGTGLSNIPWPTGTAGIAPTINMVTNNSITVTDPASIWYNLGAGVVPAAPTCSTGTPIVTAPGLQSPVKTFSFATNTTVSALGCKQGYAQSNVVTFPFTIQENAPVLASGAASYGFTFNLNEIAAPNGLTPAGIVDSANVGGADWICATNDGSAPACGAAAGACGGTGKSINGATNPGLAVPNATNTTTATTAVKAVACGVGVNASAEVDVTYTLQLAPPFLLANPAPTTKPGWLFTTTGAPVTSMTIPNGAGANFGPFTAYQVGDNGGGVCGSQTPPYNCDTTPATTTTANASANYVCWIKNATAACGTANTFATCAAGTLQNPGGGLAYNAAGTAIPATVNGGDTVSVIACSTNPNFNSSAATTVTFNAAGSATSPNIPVPANPYNQQAVVSITNADTNTSTICFTADGTAPKCGATPATQNLCVHGFCGQGGKTYNPVPGDTTNCGVGDGSAGSVNQVTASGAGSSFTIPANDDFFGGGILQKDGEVLNAIACNAAESPSPAATQTYHFTAAQPTFTSQPLVGNVTPVQGDLNGGGTVGAGTCVQLSSISNFDLAANAVAAGVVAAADPTETIAYSWTGTATCGSNTVPLNSPAVACAGGTQVLADANCITKGAPPGTRCADWNTKAANAGTCTGFGVTNAVPAGAEPVANFAQGTLVSIINTKTSACALVPNLTSGTTATLSAVTCGGTTAHQATSAPRTAQFTITVATPLLFSDQACNFAPTGSCANFVTSPWDNPYDIEFYDPTPGATLCWTIDGTVPACNAGGGGCASGNTCTGGTASAQCFNNGGGGPGSIAITMDGTTHASGTRFRAVACAASPSTLQPGGTLDTSPVLQVSAIQETPPSGTLPCPSAASPNVTITQVGSCFGASQGIANQACASGVCVGWVDANNGGVCQGAAILAQGGPTGFNGPLVPAYSFLPHVNAVTCYTTDQTLPNIATGCVSGNASTKCFMQNNGNEAAQVTDPQMVFAGLSVSGNINTLTCVPGFQGTAAAVPYTVPAYVGHITVDGLLSDWVQVAPPNGEQSSTSTNKGLGFFSYDATKAYFAYQDSGGQVAAQTGPAIAIYIGNGTAAGGATKATPSGADTWSTDTAPQGADKAGGFQRAFEWSYGAAAIAASYTWNQAGLKWTTDTTTLNVAVGNTAASPNVEFSALLSDLGSPPLMTVAGALYTNYGNTNTNATVATWTALAAPGSNYANYYKDVLASCQFPNASYGNAN